MKDIDLDSNKLLIKLNLLKAAPIRLKNVCWTLQLCIVIHKTSTFLLTPPSPLL